MTLEDFKVGDKVTWLHQPPGGYGYVIPVPATVVGIGTKQVQIDAELKDGGVKRGYVLPRNLKPLEANGCKVIEVTR